MHVPVSVGEVLDKITILEIKELRIKDPTKLANVLKELRALRAVVEAEVTLDQPSRDLIDALRQVNMELWDVEDEIRDCERRQDFGADFIRLARSVYRLNDERARLKKVLNERTGSALVEEKSYAASN